MFSFAAVVALSYSSNFPLVFQKFFCKRIRITLVLKWKHGSSFFSSEGICFILAFSSFITANLSSFSNEKKFSEYSQGKLHTSNYYFRKKTFCCWNFFYEQQETKLNFLDAFLKLQTVSLIIQSKMCLILLKLSVCSWPPGFITNTKFIFNLFFRSNIVKLPTLINSFFSSKVFEYLIAHIKSL